MENRHGEKNTPTTIKGICAHYASFIAIFFPSHTLIIKSKWFERGTRPQDKQEKRQSIKRREIKKKEEKERNKQIKSALKDSGEQTNDVCGVNAA